MLGLGDDLAEPGFKPTPKGIVPASGTLVAIRVLDRSGPN